MARSMLKSKRLLKEFWAEAIACAVYLSNRSPTRSVWSKIPQESWSGRKQGISHLRVFGSITHVHVPDKRRTKLDDKNKKFIFISYDNNCQSYKLYNPNKEKIVIGRDIIFYKEGEWDFGSNVDDFKFHPFEESNQILKEQAGEEQQEPTTLSTILALITLEDSPPSFLEKRNVEWTRNLQDFYKIIGWLENLTLFCLFTNCELVNFQEVVQNEK